MAVRCHGSGSHLAIYLLIGLLHVLAVAYASASSSAAASNATTNTVVLPLSMESKWWLTFGADACVVVGTLWFLRTFLLYKNNNSGESSLTTSAAAPSKPFIIPPTLLNNDEKTVESVDVIVVGAGIAGNGVAVALGKQGRRVLVIERDLSEPDRIVGELLQPGGLCALQKLGLEDCVENIESPIVHGYAIIKANGETIMLPYPPTDQNAKVIGRSFHHGRFVQKLREGSKRTNNVELREAKVLELLREPASDTTSENPTGRVYGVKYETRDKVVKRAYAPLTIVCDGYNSSFRKQVITQKPQTESRFYGLILENCLPLHSHHGNVFLVEPAPVLAYQVDEKDTRILVDIPETVDIKSYGGVNEFLRKVTVPQLPQSMQEAFLHALSKTRSLPSMPNSALHPDPFLCPGVVLVGDSFNMRHPLTGGGMSVALNDAIILSEELNGKDLTDTNLVNGALTRWYSRRLTLAATVNILSFALYGLFAANAKYPDLSPMRDACFAYFQLGGACVSGPMNLLSIMRAEAWILEMHFFSVAIYGMVRLLLPIPWPWKVWRAAKVLFYASRLFVPLCLANHILDPRYPQPRRISCEATL